MKYALTFTLVLGFLLTTGSPALHADELSPEVERAISKGLDWVARTQNRAGYWEGNGGQYKPAMTALAGMALLMEGSTLREGKYSTNIRRAVDWFVERSQRNGLLVNPNDQAEAGRYMYGHGFGLLFLASVYGEEEDGERRRRLEDVLTRAVQFTVRAQTSRGGWYYTSRADQGGGDADEGSTTITQVQALRAARNAGIIVPKEAIDKSQKYLHECTTERGGVIYSLAHGGRAAVGGERPPLTAAAIACQFSSGQYDSADAKKWLKFCRDHIPPLASGGRMGHDEYTHYYYAQVLYTLGDNGWAKLFGDKDPNPLTWSKYRKATFEALLKSQSADGSWAGTGSWGYIGPIYATSIYLSILQLDKGTLPIYQR
jgi:squalene cyclase